MFSLKCYVFLRCWDVSGNVMYWDVSGNVMYWDVSGNVMYWDVSGNVMYWDVSGNVSTGRNFGCLFIFIICVLLPIVFLTVKDDV